MVSFKTLSLHMAGGTSLFLYRSSDEELVHANSWPQDGRDSPLSLRDGQPKNMRFNSCHRYRMFSTVMATERPDPQTWSIHLQLQTKSTVNGAMPPHHPTASYHGVVLQHAAATANCFRQRTMGNMRLDTCKFLANVGGSTKMAFLSPSR